MAATANIPIELRYDLLAVLQHTLDAMERCERGIEDAREAGAEDLVRELRELRDAQGRQIDQLRRMLDRDEKHPNRAQDVVEEASIESFPASDAPGY